MKLNDKAEILRTKLFDLVNEFKTLGMEFWNSPGDVGAEGSSQIDGIACELAGIYDRLPPVFTDSFLDPKDREFDFEAAVGK